MDLTGTWQAAIADEALRRAYPDPGFDDSGWEPLAVPGHWRSTPAFAASDGPLLLRRAFEHDLINDGRRAWLTFDGIFYQSDVWLDGGYVGDTEGYFAPNTFEVTDALRDRRAHTLAVEVTCARQNDRKSKRNLTGVFQHWDCLDPEWNPGGIWRPVRLRTTGALAITRLRTTCLEATTDRALLSFDADVDATEPAEARLRTLVDGHENIEAQQLAKGTNRVEWTMTVEQPTLWWPHTLLADAAALVDVTVSIETDEMEHDRRTLRTGIRQVRMSDYVLSVNGERLFVKGSNQGPTRMAVGEARVEEFERDVLLAKDAGLDMLRVHAHISRPELYDAADRHGVLLWQDLPLQWGYARSVRKQAVRQARQAVDMLGHHPSVALWCAHNEPIAVDVEPGGDVDIPKGVRAGIVTFALPTYNKTVLDGSMHRALHKADRSRPVMAHSGITGRSDSHLYFGWYHGNERDLPRFAAAWPRAVRFVSEFGAQAVPASADFIDTSSWPELDWRTLGRRHALQRTFMARNGLEPTDFETFSEWRCATQEYQATVIKHHVETLRRLKYRPTGGFAQFDFADGWPGVTWSVLDHERVPKTGYDALRRACAPLIVVADRPEAAYLPGDPIALDLHVVSDLRREISAAAVTARLTWPAEPLEWQWTGDVPADSVVRIGRVEAIAPATPGPIRLVLTLHAPAIEVTNEYTSTVVGG